MIPVQSLTQDVHTWYHTMYSDNNFRKQYDEYQFHLKKEGMKLSLMVVSVKKSYRGMGICRDIIHMLEIIAGENLVIDNVINEDLAACLLKRGYIPRAIGKCVNYHKK